MWKALVFFICTSSDSSWHLGFSGRLIYGSSFVSDGDLKGTSSRFDEEDKILALLLLGWKVECFKNIFGGERE